ncbi:hypothetical protein ACQV5M_21485, partial [Leptospira sp. SA-E8]|uniref:hypothetical protein n=1 Tax=Leptospira sp. SA-E8 TaxID=3422259 RepID=UPI003EC01B70
LERITEIQAIKVHGSAPYSISVLARRNGTWSTVDGLNQLKLSSLPAAWNRFNANQSVSTDALRLRITHVVTSGGGGGTGSGATGGLAEIEILAVGEHAMLQGPALVKAWPLDLSVKTGTGSSATATPPQTRAYAVSAAQTQTAVGLDGQTFNFAVDLP